GAPVLWTGRGDLRLALPLLEREREESGLACPFAQSHDLLLLLAAVGTGHAPRSRVDRRWLVERLGGEQQAVQRTADVRGRWSLDVDHERGDAGEKLFVFASSVFACRTLHLFGAARFDR